MKTRDHVTRRLFSQEIADDLLSRKEFRASEAGPLGQEHLATLVRLGYLRPRGQGAYRWNRYAITAGTAGPSRYYWAVCDTTVAGELGGAYSVERGELPLPADPTQEELSAVSRQAWGIARARLAVVRKRARIVKRGGSGS